MARKIKNEWITLTDSANRNGLLMLNTEGNMRYAKIAINKLNIPPINIRLAALLWELFFVIIPCCIIRYKPLTIGIAIDIITSG